MILLNFSHPLTEEQITEIESLSKNTLNKALEFALQMDNGQNFETQIRSLVNNIPLSPKDWQNEAILINPPAYNFAAAVLMAELHGRMGYFAPVIRLRPIKDSLPPRYEVAEIINLQKVRDEARKYRGER